MKRLVILSGKGGTGKTTVSAALIHLSQAKAVADCDVDAPNLHLVTRQTCPPQVADFMGGDKAVVTQKLCTGCGICEKRCQFGAITVTRDGASVNPYACEGCGVCQLMCPTDAITLVPDVAGQRQLYLGDSVFSTATLKMGRGNSGKLVSEVKTTMLKSAPACDLAILDGSPGIGCPVMASLGGMDMALIVAEPSNSGISDCKRLVQTAQGFGVKLAICVNKWDISPSHTAEIEAFCTQQHLPFVGKIPFDPQAVQAINNGATVAEVDCPARTAIGEIYRKIQHIL
ncbi:ATP-binding protein [Bengtsoniella intestinalis]|uniref:ATP-binding protein n=1 Tax=Bengtsoniella intestinalis TaxID=3073143 RepID=UPI00391FBF43